MEHRNERRQRLAPSARALMVTDALALVAFVLAGAASHRDSGVLVVIGRNLVPLGAAWMAATVLVGTYRRRSWGSMVLTWAIAAPVGILVRSWAVGSPRGSELGTFLLVGSGFSLLFLSVGRALVAGATRARAGEQPA
ncbi:MAG: DUF3054 domain-containing protein [Actinomycetota bacterium]